jgi:orotidine 5'-phosphate decarboxylase subfamily 1
LKTHIDIIVDFDWDLIQQLVALAKKHNFLIIEDRKFCDIGSIVQQQYKAGVYRIVEWADIVIAHAISGVGVIEGLKQIGKPYNRAMFLLAQMSSGGNLIDEKYTQRAVALAEQQSDFVIGMIAQERCSHDPALLIITPGINMQQKTDDFRQQYNSPEYAIGQRGTDVIIVGRAIYGAVDPVAVVQEYREIGWKTYLDRIL